MRVFQVLRDDAAANVVGGLQRNVGCRDHCAPGARLGMLRVYRDDARVRRVLRRVKVELVVLAADEGVVRVPLVEQRACLRAGRGVRVEELDGE